MTALATLLGYAAMIVSVYLVGYVIVDAIRKPKGE